MDISPASVHDIHYLKDIQHQLKDYILLGNKACLSTKHQLNLFESHNVRLETPMRRNQHNITKNNFMCLKSQENGWKRYFLDCATNLCNALSLPKRLGETTQDLLMDSKIEYYLK